MSNNKPRATQTPAASLEAAIDLTDTMARQTIEHVTKFVANQPAVAKHNRDAITDNLKQAAELAQGNATESQAKALDLIEQNTKALFAYVRELSTIRTPEAFWALQQQFITTQSAATLRQSQEVNTYAVGMLREFANPVQSGLNKTFAAWLGPKAA